MHARVATFEGGDPEQIRQGALEIKRRAESGLPEGVPAVEFLLLHNAERGKVLSITLYENEADMRQGDATLSAMDRPGSGPQYSTRSVETYEVGVKLER